MVKKTFIILILSLVELKVHGQSMEGFIVGGDLADIKDYTHSAFLTIKCNTGYGISYFVCGSSVLNQVILITAAHCLEECTSSSRITVNAGDEHRKKGLVRSVRSFKLHENYDPKSITNDICLLKLKRRMELGDHIQRIFVMPKPPHFKTAQLAGWGLIDEENQINSLYLKHTSQSVWSRKKCLKVLSSVPPGAFCAGDLDGEDFAAQGDSGSALVVNQYIQIGLVSYKNPHISRSLVVYTDIAHQYNWIQKTAEILYCKGRRD